MENEQIVQNYQNKYLLSTPLYSDMAGGLNTRVSPPQMAVNQSQVARNVIYNIASGALSARDGSVEYNPHPIPLAVTSGLYGFTQARFRKGHRFIAIGGGGGDLAAFYLDHPYGDAWHSLAVPGFVGQPINRFVSMAFYNDALVCFDGVNPPYKVTFTGNNPEISGYYPLGDVAEAPSFLVDAEFVVPYNNRLYVASSKSSRLSWSDELGADAVLGSVPAFPSANSQNIGGISDGEPVMGLAVAYGHLIIFKRDSIYALSATDGVPSITQVGRSIGLVSKGSFCSAENSVWFFGPSGVYSIGSDLTPEFESDYVLPDYQDIINDFSYDHEPNNVPSFNHPMFGYNADKQQVWVSCYRGDMTDPRRNIVYVHDLVNKDSSGRAAISTYAFYQSDIRNYTPNFMVSVVDPDTNKTFFLSVSRKTEAADVDVNEGVANPYRIYRHDVPLSEGSLGDDGNLVEWMWESKYLNLGDPLRLKRLRYYTVFGDPRDEVSTLYTNQNYSYNVLSQLNSRHTVSPVVARGVASVCVGDYIYCFGGLDSSGAYLRSIRVYRISTDTWTTLQVSSLPADGLAFAQAVYDGSGYIYLVGGATASSAATRKIYQFSITAPGELSAPQEYKRFDNADALSYMRCMFGCCMVGDKIYCMGGSVADPDNIAFTFEAFDVTNRTSAGIQSPFTGVLAGPCLVNDGVYIYMIWGTSVRRHTIGSPTWQTSVNAAFPVSLVFASAFLHNGFIYILGGSPYSATPGAGSPLATAYKYTPDNGALFNADALEARAPMASPRSLFAPAMDAGGNFYYIAGTGFPIRAYFSSTDDFKNYYSTDVDIVLNKRSLVPASINYLSRYWSITFRGRISEGIARVIGFNLDYTMFQRRG